MVQHEADCPLFECSKLNAVPNCRYQSDGAAKSSGRHLGYVDLVCPALLQTVSHTRQSEMVVSCLVEVHVSPMTWMVEERRQRQPYCSVCSTLMGRELEKEEQQVVKND